MLSECIWHTTSETANVSVVHTCMSHAYMPTKKTDFHPQTFINVPLASYGTVALAPKEKRKSSDEEKKKKRNISFQ